MRYTYCLIVPIERLKNVEMYFVLLFAICYIEQYLLYLHTCTIRTHMHMIYLLFKKLHVCTTCPSPNILYVHILVLLLEGINLSEVSKRQVLS